MSDVYADNVANVTVVNGIARIDLVAVEKIDQVQKQATMRPSGRVIIPMAGLLQLGQVIENLKAEMERQQAAPTQVN